MDEPDTETDDTNESEPAPIALVMVESDTADACAADGTGC
jgi:hypothetical protein